MVQGDFQGYDKSARETSDGSGIYESSHDAPWLKTLLPNTIMQGRFSQFEALLKERFPKARAFKPGDLMHGPNEISAHMSYYITKGLVNTGFVNEAGEYTELAVRGPGSILPLYYSSQETSMGLAQLGIAATPCEVICIPKKEIGSLIVEIPDFAVAMIDSYCELSIVLEYSLMTRLHSSLVERVAEFLGMHANENRTVKATQEEIAQAVGGSRSRVAEALGHLRNEGLVETHRGYIVITDPDRLLERCSFALKGW